MRKIWLFLVSALTVVAFVITPTSAGAAVESDGLWGNGDVPPCIADGSGPCLVGDFGSIELGVRFETAQPIYVVGVRFYRADAGTWSGSLWGTDGSWITSANDGTSGAGWQDAMFATPQLMIPGETFTASYFAPGGAYAFEWDYFTGGGHTVGPVTALGGAGANGKFSYGSTSSFPTTTFRETNYWVTPLWVEDTKKPEITITSPGDGATYLLNEQVVADYACTDDYDPSPSCVGTVADGAFIDTASVGSKSFTVDSEDASGNEGDPVTHEYSVGYGFEGFFSPVDNTMLNVAKAGQSIPLKFRLVDANGAPITNLTSVTVKAASLTCSLGGTEDLLEEYASGSSGLQDLGDGYYQFNWKTPKSYAKSCKTLSLNLGEGPGFERTAEFQFTK